MSADCFDSSDPSIVDRDGRKLIIGKGKFPMPAPLYVFYIYAFKNASKAAGEEAPEYDPEKLYINAIKLTDEPLNIGRVDLGYGELELNVKISRGPEADDLIIDVTDYKQVEVNRTFAVSIFDSCEIQSIFNDSESDSDDDADASLTSGP